MADRAAIDLGGTRGETEREQTFWNSSILLMKSTVEDQWLDMVHKAKRKPNYGMRDLNGVMEERALNKLELVGPMVDSYLKNMGMSILSKLGRSKCTGLMPPVNIFIPWIIFRHVCVLIVGYDGDMKVTDKMIELTISSYKTAKRVFSPVRTQGTNCLKKRKYKRVVENGRSVMQLDGRAAVMVTSKSPITLAFNRKQENVCLTFYAQRYDINEMATDLSLQRLISSD